MRGFVSIVGAGPGDPDLISIRGHRRLLEADTVIYDALLDSVILDEIPIDTEKIYAGKRAGFHTLSQREINELLIKKAREGKRIVRLKGGDPFVFGRGAEEALALKRAGIAYEIVPGITAGIAVPAYAGIPVTLRGVSSSFACLTGHEAADKGNSTIDWHQISSSVDTIIIYMGFRNLPTIVSKLLIAGKPDETPVAVIHWGTVNNQRSVTGTLASIESDVETAKLKSPAIIIVGEVVKFKESLAWFNEKDDFNSVIEDLEFAHVRG